MIPTLTKDTDQRVADLFNKYVGQEIQFKTRSDFPVPDLDQDDPVLNALEEDAKNAGFPIEFTGFLSPFGAITNDENHIDRPTLLLFFGNAVEREDGSVSVSAVCNIAKQDDTIKLPIADLMLENCNENTPTP